MPTITHYPNRGPAHLPEERKWSHLIKLPGVKSGMKIPVKCEMVEYRYQLVTPRRVRVTAQVDISTEEVDVRPGNNKTGPRVRWKVSPDTIPQASTKLTISHMINVPKDQPAILRIEKFDLSASIEQVTTLRDRVVVKGRFNMNTWYQQRQG